jgi:ferric-dicitrate binding protein FerR (iron transport regulator)
MSGDRSDPRASDPIEALIRAGGHRADPPDGAYEAVWAAAEKTWRGKVARRRRWQVGLSLAAAAAVGALAVALAYLPWRSAAPPVEVARLDRVLGLVEQRESRSSDWLTSTVQGGTLPGGSGLRTGRDSGAGLLFADQLSVRLAADTEIELSDSQRIALVRGTVYVDAGGQVGGGLEVDTPQGQVRHLGTQYELHSVGAGLRIRVREGRVLLEQRAGNVIAEAGEQVSISAGGAVERAAIAAHDPRWRWTEALAPMPALDGRPARVLLEWAARETGRELRYVNARAQQRAAEAILHGHFGRLSPTQALDVLTATTDLDYRLEDGSRITVEAR